MCGIAGYFNPSTDEPGSEELLRRMNGVLAHRGPDDEGIFTAEGVGLAHRRLSVIDPKGGHQPLVSEDGKTAIVLNGEIYNYRELRRELLGRGMHFRTESDTEVVLRMYEWFGWRCVHHLRGMFAVAIWDSKERSLWLARDRIGIKPLYYFWDSRMFLFGSELKAILEHPGVPRSVDERAIDDFMTLSYIPAPRTIFRGIQKLRAGHMLTVTAGGVTESEYWDLDFTPRVRRGDAAALHEALRETVRSHLVSDVPVGSLLSGGVDSTAVLALMAEETGSGIQSFTASFPGTLDEDRIHARVAASSYASDWHDIQVTVPTPEVLDRLAWHYDEPFADPSAVPTYQLCAGARSVVPVCLSGDGGDECFGGYRRYRTSSTLASIRRLVPETMAENVFATAARLAPAGKWLPKPLHFRSMMNDVLVEPARIYWREMVRCDAGLRDSLYNQSLKTSLGDYDPFSIMEPYLRKSEGWDSTSQLQYLDFKTYLADGILTKVDRASMAHGLEVRVPFLDVKLVEFITQIPSSVKVGTGRGKELLKRALRNDVSPAIRNRRKRGFTPPLVRWMKGGLEATIEERLLTGDPFVSRFLEMGALRSLWEDHRSGVRKRPELLWSILVLENWGRRFQ